MFVIAIHPASTSSSGSLSASSTLNGSRTCEPSNLRTFELIFCPTLNPQLSTIREPANLNSLAAQKCKPQTYLFNGGVSPWPNRAVWPSASVSRTRN